MLIVRLSKIAMTAALAAFAFIVTFNNLVDYNSNYEFVKHVLSMDTTFPGNKLTGLVAAILVSPILMLCFFLVGMAGAYLIAVVNLGVDHGQFIHYVRQFLKPLHVVHGFIKAGVFGFAVVLIGCYQGFYARGGGRGVGIGTNRAVVAGSVAVLSLDYFLSDILLKVLPAVSK